MYFRDNPTTEANLNRSGKTLQLLALLWGLPIRIGPAEQQQTTGTLPALGRVISTTTLGFLLR